VTRAHHVGSRGVHARVALSLAAFGALASIAIVACSGEAGPPPPAAVDAGGLNSAAIARGEYLVRTVGGCGECHTPRDATGAIDESQWLGGVPNRFDLVPDDVTMGAVPAPNLTPYALSTWSDAAIIRAIKDGLDADGEPLTSLMPSYVFHNLTDDDASAIVQYLRTVQPVSTDIDDRQPLPFSLTSPPVPIDDAEIPHSTSKPTGKTYATAERGRYLAAMAGVCVDCHSPWSAGVASPLDTDRLFAGGRALGTGEWGGDAATGIVLSTNLTPDATGLDGWSVQDVATAITTGVAPNGATLCAPMTTHAGAAFAGLTSDDATAIATYLTTLAPIANDGVTSCSGAGPAVEDAGSDASPGDDDGGDAGSEAGSDAGTDASVPDANSPDAADANVPDAATD
jgi:mono/diheme cytochrome c family protein